MTDATAGKLIDDALKYEEQLLDVRRKYVKEARFYQLENKLDAIGNFVIADKNPLMK